ncbi:replicative DNA helicase [Algibacillus agarilyticus]|uniref:replicative DNA helicase n=1 Tax=Algibacillus agarilyticus TaxID=2234133 RepID=UPI000DCFCDB5|nr:replicative DNA helicase [Algibacillus agarilyticus]
MANDWNKKKKPTSVEDIKAAPHSLEAEQSVIGGLLLDNETWDQVAERVVAQDFYNRANRLVFENMAQLVEANKPIDLITISEALDQAKVLDDIGGFAYLAEVADNTPSAANITAYADIVRERAVLRELIGVANEIAEAGYDPQGRDANELLDFAESKVFKIAEQRTNANEGPQSMGIVLENTIKRIEEAMTLGKDGVTGVTTGFAELDKLTSGMQPSDLIIVAARPSMGKTTFAMNLVENASLAHDKPVLVFSLEMPAEQIMMRSLASLSRVNQTSVRTGQLEDDDWARISSTVSLLNQRQNIFIDDSSGLTPTEVRSRARRVHRDHGGISMIMVDYLQLMTVPSLSDNRTLEIAEISRSLKSLAKELQVPVIALSQLNRGLEQRADKRPINSDLRESGSIEQDADLIMFIYRDEVYNENSEFKGIGEIIIGKQRNGPLGVARLAFQGQYSRFDNLANPGDYGDYE